MLTIGTGRTLSQEGSNSSLICFATSAEGNNTVLARRAFVQPNFLASCPIIWNSSTGLPDFLAASQAAANDSRHLTSPGFTVGFAVSLSGVLAPRRDASAAAAAAATTVFVGNSTTRLPPSAAARGPA